MEAIKDTILQVFKNIEAKKPGSGALDPQEWFKNALTKKELGHIKFRTLRKGVVYLNVDSSSWLYYFSLQKERFLSRFKEKFSEAHEIRLRLGEVR